MVQYDWWIRNVPKQPMCFKAWLGDVDNASRVWFRGFVVGGGQIITLIKKEQ